MGTPPPFRVSRVKNSSQAPDSPVFAHILFRTSIVPAPADISFEAADELVRALRRLTISQRGRKAELLHSIDLQIGQDVVLVELHRLQRASQIELAEAVEVDEPSVARSIQRLEKKKLVQRSRDPRDARRRVVELTSVGEKLIPKIERIYLQFAHEVLGDGGEKERKRLLKLLNTTIGRISG